MGRSILEKMGCSNSGTVKKDALRLCKERKRFVKQAIDSRCALAAAHVSYTHALRNIGACLRRYAEAEAPTESSLSTTSAATELEKSPSHSSYPSPSPSHLAESSDSPLHNVFGNPNPRPASPPTRNLSYMKAEISSSLTFMVNPLSGGFVEDDLLEAAAATPAPPPPPRPGRPHSSSSWDYFDTSDDFESFRFVGHNERDVDSVCGWEQFKQGNAEFDMVDCDRTGAKPGPNTTMRFRGDESPKPEEKKQACDGGDVGLVGGNDLCSEREDPSEFITHRAKDFVSSIKDIEHRFFRASESGREVSRLLEANKIRVGFAETKGRATATAFLGAFKHVCCRGKTSLVSQEPMTHATKVIIWKRTSSSRSSSSKIPLIPASKEDPDDSGSDFVEEFCMISGSHSSTLDRLYAWERKLYDEVKAIESIRKEYDRKCEQLRNQFAKDHTAHAIDKTRAVVKDLHSRIRVAIQSVDSISKRIEKIRDEELQPQLLELIQGLIRMWKAMLECHHSQYITISLAYHSRNSSNTPPENTHKKQILSELLDESECFGLSFANLVNGLTSYVEALNGWLQHCILLPQERSRNRRPWSPRRVLAPPIFVLCRDWSAGIKSLPSDELNGSIEAFSSDLCLLMDRQGEHAQKNEISEKKDDEKNDPVSVSVSVSSLSCIHGSLSKVLERLNKFSEASLKMYEDVKQKTEAARVAYTSNCMPVRY